jgi:predicted amidohydrolase
MSARSPALHRFHPISIQLGDEDQMLERTRRRIADLEPGEIAVFPELLAWSPEASGRTFVWLVHLAQAHGVSIITTLNLPPELAEDLPGRDPEARYNALCIFCRTGDVHVPQAKLTPQSFETSTSLGDAGIGVSPYRRLNRVRLDVGDDHLIDTRFLICSDLWTLTRLTPRQLGCDLLVVPANFARGAETHAAQALDEARAAGAAKATLLVNAFHLPKSTGRPPLAVEIDEMVEAEPVKKAKRTKVAERWPDAAAMRDHFRVLQEDARDFAAMVESKAREGRIGVPRSLAEAPLELGEYPVTVVL